MLKPTGSVKFRPKIEPIFRRFIVLICLQTEMSCCRRIVQLCRDCLLIVYQFAADAKAAGAASVVSQGTTPQKSDMRSVTKSLHGSAFDSEKCFQFDHRL